MRSHKPKSKPTTSSGQIRIIGGKFRSRKLKVLDVEGLRPTTDRVKETVFNWLMPYTSNARVLDCYSGSGALGFEALSRYAENVTFIELDKLAHKQIAENIKLLNADNTQLFNGNCLELLPKMTGPFDLVFIDPPFRKDLASSTCKLLEMHDLLTDDAVIYLEVEKELTNLELPSNWQILKEKNFGQVTSYLLQR
ncbi:16S rRNA (guanine(966)-N(2))-methyltransferase RsmD [Pseudoalteromonas piratica]|uniref:Ribosomal RNA small subunit methyltransferase D n=1 Tax=Pseudoalteromonas piratica TaxID=1348114 RepID=A0A0A7EFM6_9GAMM|nr:16S rRNA (guanine(966)-N(2))-methyltransferase RsmD [Pseudoalteromonas piratica]AIY64861.1 methyltransferase [Pseudoalteromonas piratica]